MRLPGPFVRIVAHQPNLPQRPISLDLTLQRRPKPPKLPHLTVVRSGESPFLFCSVVTLPGEEPFSEDGSRLRRPVTFLGADDGRACAGAACRTTVRPCPGRRVSRHQRVTSADPIANEAPRSRSSGCRRRRTIDLFIFEPRQCGIFWISQSSLRRPRTS
jgi:hypothetical protein